MSNELVSDNFFSSLPNFWLARWTEGRMVATYGAHEERD